MIILFFIIIIIICLATNLELVKKEKTSANWKFVSDFHLRFRPSRVQIEITF